MAVLIAIDWWLALVGGGLAALLLPALLLLLGVAIPLGWVGDATLTFEVLRDLFERVPGLGVALIGVHALIFWHAAHQLRQLLRDLGWRGAPALAALGYSGAAAGTAWAAQLLTRL